MAPLLLFILLKLWHTHTFVWTITSKEKFSASAVFLGGCNSENQLPLWMQSCICLLWFVNSDKFFVMLDRMLKDIRIFLKQKVEQVFIQGPLIWFDLGLLKKCVNMPPNIFLIWRFWNPATVTESRMIFIPKMIWLPVKMLENDEYANLLQTEVLFQIPSRKTTEPLLFYGKPRLRIHGCEIFGGPKSDADALYLSAKSL